MTITISSICNLKANASTNKSNELLQGSTISELMNNSYKEIKKGPSKSYGKVVYITIDDGPSEYTDEIIKILEKNNIKATFFMIENNMKAYPNQVENIVKSGNIPGFHSVSHDINKLYKTNSSAKEEFDINQNTFYSITGQKSNIVRLPFGSKPYTPRDTYNNLLDSGYKLWDWNVDTEDWKSTPSQIVANVKKYSKDKDNVVLLMHERKQSVQALDEMIKVLKKEGFEFATISERELERNFWLENLSNSDN